MKELNILVRSITYRGSNQVKTKKMRILKLLKSESGTFSILSSLPFEKEIPDTIYVSEPLTAFKNPDGIWEISVSPPTLNLETI